MPPNRSLLLIVGGVAVLVVLAMAVVLLDGNDRPQTFPADSAEAGLQAYLAAWDKGDLPAAYSSFSERVRSTTSLATFQLAAEQVPPNGPSRRVFIDQVTGSGDRQIVHLVVEERWSNGLNSDVQRTPRTIRMVRDPEGWRIDEPLVWLDPMPTYDIQK